MDDEQLFEEMRFISDERLEEAIKLMPLNRLLLLADLEPGDEAERRQWAWAGYMGAVPALICIAAGAESREIRDSHGIPVEVCPSYCVRIMALDVLAECGGLGNFLRESGLGCADEAEEKRALATFRASLDSEIRADLGVTLRRARQRYRQLLRRITIRPEVRLGLEEPNFMEQVLAGRELGRLAMGR